MSLPSTVAKEKVAKRRSLTGAAINMWPFAAILLVILFILMGPSMTVVHRRYASTDLPIATSVLAQPKSRREDAITVQVSRDGSVFFRNQKIVVQDLPQYIRDAVKEGAEPRIYLSGDARSRYGDIQVVVTKIREAGIKDVVILTESAR